MAIDLSKIKWNDDEWVNPYHIIGNDLHNEALMFPGRYAYLTAQYARAKKYVKYYSEKVLKSYEDKYLELYKGVRNPLTKKNFTQAEIEMIMRKDPMYQKEYDEFLKYYELEEVLKGQKEAMQQKANLLKELMATERARLLKSGTLYPAE